MLSNSGQMTLILTLIVAVLLVVWRRRRDLIALMTMIFLGLTGLVSADQVFAGFSGAAALTILSISMISEALRQTGVTRWLGQQIRKYGGKGETQVIAVTMLAAAILSLFMNNIAALAVLLPSITVVTRRTRYMPSRVMIPLAYGILLGGMATLLTTSNILVSSFLVESGFPAFGLLDFLPIGLPLVLVGILYTILVGRRFLPQRYPAGEAARSHRLRAELTSLYGLEKQLCHLKVLSDSPLAGKSLKEGQWTQGPGFTVIGLERNHQLKMTPPGDTVLQAGDALLAQGEVDSERLNRYGLQELDRNIHLDAQGDENTLMVELVLGPHSRLIGKTLREVQFREKYGFTVLGIWRNGNPLPGKIADLDLQFGDTLLVQGPSERLPLLRNAQEFLVMEEDPTPVLRPGKAGLSAAITLVTLGIASLNILPVQMVSLAGAALMVLTGCLSMDEAYRSVDWRLIFLIAGLWPLGVAIQTSGLAGVIAQQSLGFLGSFSPIVLAAMILLITALVAWWIGGQVTPLLVAPAALAIAKLVGIDPRSMGIVVALGCSLVFANPFGHPVLYAVMSPGGYQWKDFLKAGLPLTVILFGMILIGLKLFWGL